MKQMLMGRGPNDDDNNNNIDKRDISNTTNSALTFGQRS